MIRAGGPPSTTLVYTIPTEGAPGKSSNLQDEERTPGERGPERPERTEQGRHSCICCMRPLRGFRTIVVPRAPVAHPELEGATDVRRSPRLRGRKA